MRIEMVGRNISEKLLASGTAPYALLGAVGMKEENLVKVLAGMKMPNAYTLYRMARFLGCTMDELMEGVDEPGSTGGRFHGKDSGQEMRLSEAKKIKDDVEKKTAPKEKRDGRCMYLRDGECMITGNEECLKCGFFSLKFSEQLLALAEDNLAMKKEIKRLRKEVADMIKMKGV